MAFTLTLPLSPSTSLSPKTNSLIKKWPLHFPKLPFRFPKNSRTAISCSAQKPFMTEENILEAVADFVGAEKSVPPCVRTYENDLARLSLVGAVDFQQALTAAAADGGEAANEHIAAGMPAMVVETLFPGPCDEHSTVSTRLFLPARKVVEKAQKLKSALTKEILSGTTSTNILAMTFRQVLLQHLWNFELVLFIPGAERNMDDLETPRQQVPPSFAITSSDERVISVISEVICLSSLESTRRHLLKDTPGGAVQKFFPWFHKHKCIVSKDSSVTLYNLLESQIVANANILLQKFSSERANYRPREGRWTSNWLTSSAYSKLEQIGGPEFISWLSEYVPAYKLEIDAEKLRNVKFEGWKESATNTWEVFLTHSQMVGLSDILDMYYEDVYTLPNKQLSSGVVAKSFNLPSSKRSISMSKAISMVLASGIFLVAIRVLSQCYLPHIPSRKNYHQEIYPVNSCDMISIQHQPMASSKSEEYCVSIIRRIKEFYGWPGDIVMGSGSSASIGELPVYLRYEMDPKDLDLNSSSTPSEGIEDEMKAAAQDIASYQVVLSADGKIVGFQPTSRVAVNQWAANPLVKELYGGTKLSPGLIERGLKISHPGDVIVLELLMSVNPQSSFALVRPVNAIAENCR
ncbi:PREDICTED: uncharacterized protein LOC109216321 isoform X1 [Nicotiana attenuata]|uniref:uncharacterized protein LOC109216321 isoform X1 n=1 Tax=Nicotiana attenuata TaxID=49451 RepID=UPI0009052C07|nr:PREDICTED: uncharacterized protein LOC109216321 isoform X1 [Nicotiana attenuata]